MVPHIIGKEVWGLILILLHMVLKWDVHKNPVGMMSTFFWPCEPFSAGLQQFLPSYVQLFEKEEPDCCFCPGRVAWIFFHDIKRKTW